MTSNMKQELRAEVRPMCDEKFGVFLVRGEVVVDCVAEYRGPLAYEWACRQAARGGVPWSSNVPGDLPQAQSNLTEFPFLTAVGGHVLIHDGVTGEPLAETWEGVCCDSRSVKSFWYVGREQNERSFNKLKAHDYLEAVQEARHLVTSMRSVKRYSGSQSLIRAYSYPYANADDARDALTTISAQAGFVFGYVDEIHRRTVTFHADSIPARTDLESEGLTRVFSFTREAAPASAT